MTRHIPFSIALSFLALVPQASGRAASEQTTGSALQLNVRIYDYARPGTQILDRGRQEAARVLAKAGVQTTWLNCPLTIEERETPCVQQRVRPDGSRNPHPAPGDAPNGQQPNRNLWTRTGRRWSGYPANCVHPLRKRGAAGLGSGHRIRLWHDPPFHTPPALRWNPTRPCDRSRDWPLVAGVEQP